MNQALLLRLHRWLTLVFAIPLLVVIGTGLVLSLQPIVQTTSIKPGSLTIERLDGLMQKFDPERKATALSIDAYENTLSLRGVGADGETDIDLATGEEATDEGAVLSEMFGYARNWHEHFLFDLRWLVTASTFAMLGLALLGVLMGLPRLRNTISGWHKGIAWILLPLVVISPLTGLALSFGITFTTPMARTPAVPLTDAVRLVAARTDPSNLVSIGNRGGRQLARILEGPGELRGYVLTREGLRATERNWPRLIHEGNWAGTWSGLVNLVTALAMLALLGTGLTLWTRRTFRRRNRVRATAPARPAQASQT